MLDLGHGVDELALCQQNRRLGARVHHEHVGPELLQAPGHFLAIGVLGHEREKIEVALRVAHHAGEIVELKQAQVTMIILDPFLLHLGALFRGQLVILALFSRARGAQLMINEERFATVRPVSIGPAGHLHLQNAEVDP